MTKKRTIYLDIIKILAIVLVLFNHSHWFIVPTNIIYNGLHLFLFSICKIAVPLFIMVTGALLLKKETTYKEVFKKRILRTVIALLLVMIIKAIFDKISIFHLLKNIFMHPETSTNYPFWIWYIYLLIGLYLMIPFIQKMIKNFDNKDFLIFIGIVVIGTGLINQLNPIMSMITKSELAFNKNFIGNIFPISIGYLITGYYLDNLKIDSKIFKISIIALFISIIAGTLLLWQGMKLGYGYDQLLEYTYLLVAISAISTFISIKYLFSKPIKKEIFTKTIILFSNSVFGVYLFHTFFIDNFQNLLHIDSLFGIVILDIFVFLVLSFIIYFIKFIPFMKKIL